MTHEMKTTQDLKFNADITNDDNKELIVSIGEVYNQDEEKQD